jgi:hypothetical protein
MYDAFVAEGVGRDLKDPNLFGVPHGKLPALAAQLGTYRKAVVLYALLRLAESNAKTDQIAIAYGHLIFGAEPTAHGVEAMEEVEAARKEIERLVEQLPDIPVDWAEQWLSKIGMTGENPAVLSAVCLHWIDVTVRALETVKEITQP